MSSDDDLLEAWRRGDRVAGQALFDRHFDAIRRFFQNKAGADAEDLVQQTFERCVAARERYSGRSSFRSYLLGISRHVLHEYYRRVRHDADFELASIADLDPGPSTLVRRAEQERLLVAALRSIPIALQTTLELYYWEDLSGPELAEALDIPESTVRSRIHRAKHRLTQALEELANSRELLESTTGNLERWAAGLREPEPVS